LSLATLTSTLIAADVGSEALAAVRVDSPLLLAEASFRTILPRAFWRLRPGADRRYHASAARLRGMLETVVVDYRRSGRDPGDLLSGLLMHPGPGSGDVLDDEAVIDELLGFLMCGIESPAGLFVALIHEPVRAPGVRGGRARHRPAVPAQPPAGDDAALVGLDQHAHRRRAGLPGRRRGPVRGDGRVQCQHDPPRSTQLHRPRALPAVAVGAARRRA